MNNGASGRGASVIQRFVLVLVAIVIAISAAVAAVAYAYNVFVVSRYDTITTMSYANGYDSMVVRDNLTGVWYIAPCHAHTRVSKSCKWRPIAVDPHLKGDDGRGKSGADSGIGKSFRPGISREDAKMPARRYHGIDWSALRDNELPDWESQGIPIDWGRYTKLLQGRR